MTQEHIPLICFILIFYIFMHNYIIKPATKLNRAKQVELRKKFTENEWKYLLFALKDHDVIMDTSTMRAIVPLVEDNTLAEYYGVDLKVLKSKIRGLTPCRLEALCSRVYYYWHPEISYVRLNRDEYIPETNLLAERPSEKTVLDFCKF